MFSTGVLAVSIVFAVTAHPARTAGPVHLAAPPVAEEQGLPADHTILRVCADPNNLPFSNDRLEGFENRVADLVAHALGKSVRYYWRPQRRGFLRSTLDAGACDVVMGVPASLDRVRATRPYYRSSYVFVSRRDRGLRLRSLDDPRLRRLRIGIPITGDDYDNPPPAAALAARNIIDNVHGYTVYGDYSRPTPSAGVLAAVADGAVDVAIAWGPPAGFFAQRSRAPLDLAPVRPETDTAACRFAFDIAIGVRRDDRALAAALDAAVAAHASEIQRILASFGVPLTQSRLGVQG